MNIMDTTDTVIIGSVFLVFLGIGLAVYYLFFYAKEGEKCKPEKDADEFGLYQYDDNKECVLSNCVTGYKLTAGKCVKQYDAPIDTLSDADGIQPSDCVISGYKPGLCKDKVKGEVLTGYGDLYGDGYMEKYAIITKPSTGNGKCENTKLEKQSCRVEQVAQCKAPQELWTSDDDTSCTAIFDGEKKTLETGSGFCGVGTKVKTLKESNITGEIRGDKSIEEYKKSVNWDVCSEAQSSSCNVICDDGDTASKCPGLRALGWNTDNKCYVKNDAEKYILGNIEYENIREMSAIKREDAETAGAFDTSSGELDTTKLTKGLEIYYLTGNQYNDEELRKNGCSVMYTKECIPDLEPAPCEYTETSSVCVDHACGQNQARTITRNQSKAAFGNGSCVFVALEDTSEGCPMVTKPCCDKNNSNHYKISSCESNGKGKYNSDNSLCSPLGSQLGGSTETFDCCYLSAWESGACYDSWSEYPSRKYNRTILNENLCTSDQFFTGVNKDETIVVGNPSLKLVDDETCPLYTGTGTGTSSGDDTDYGARADIGDALANPR